MKYKYLLCSGLLAAALALTPALGLEGTVTAADVTVQEGFGEAVENAEEKFYGLNCVTGGYEVQNWADIIALAAYDTEQGGDSSLGAGSADTVFDAICSLNISEPADVAEKAAVIRKVRGESSVSGFYQPILGQVSLDDYMGPSWNTDTAGRYGSKEFLLEAMEAAPTEALINAYAGPDLSDARVGVLKSALSLLGKVGYFWGGKYEKVGWNADWGSLKYVTSEGSDSTGTQKPYGLDCSGFVQWSYINGLGGDDAGIGISTWSQWKATDIISPADAIPGDLAFRTGPWASSNHVGIIIGWNDNGEPMAIHCSSAHGGVCITTAKEAGFRYFRRVKNF